MSLEKNSLGVLLLSSHTVLKKHYSLAGGGDRKAVVFLLVNYIFARIFCLLAAVRNEKEKKKCLLLENLKFPFMQQIILIVCSNCRVQITTNHSIILSCF